MPNEKIPVNPELRTQVILAAVNSVGENPAYTEPNPELRAQKSVQWQADIREAVSELCVMVGDRSPMSKLADNILGAKVFPAIMVNIVKEGSSKRGLAYFFTKVHPQNAKYGIETARTDFMENHGGPGPGLPLAKKIQSLKGRRVLVYLWYETPANGGNDVRMISTVQDIGEVSADQLDTAQAAYADYLKANPL